MGCRGPLLLGFMLLALAETGKKPKYRILTIINNMIAFILRCQPKEHSRAQAVQVHGPDHPVHVLLLLRLPEGISAICGNIAAEIP